MTPNTKWEYMKAVYKRYLTAPRKEKHSILDEFCKTYGCHRKHAIRMLNAPPPPETRPLKVGRKPYYFKTTIAILEEVWKLSGYLWSQRLKAAIPLWLPYIKKHFRITTDIEQQLLSISPAQIDRRLKHKKILLRKQIYGTTKPGTLLKHHIPIKTDSWNIRRPGFTEIDLVSHSGNNADGDFAHTLNQTDIKTTWIERRAILGKNRKVVTDALDEMRADLPFPLLGIDADNGSEFINTHLYTYCQQSPKIQFTRGRPYKKDDNAHIEQKNWTHVRKLLGYQRYDTQEAVDAMNDLYKNELRWFQNLFQPSVKLIRKVRIGSRITRIYDKPQTPFQRVQACSQTFPAQRASLQQLFASLDPIELSKTIQVKLSKILHMETASKVSNHCPTSLRRLNQIVARRFEQAISSHLCNSSRTAQNLSYPSLHFDDVEKFRKIHKREVALGTR